MINLLSLPRVCLAREPPLVPRTMPILQLVALHHQLAHEQVDLTAALPLTLPPALSATRAETGAEL